MPKNAGRSMQKQQRRADYCKIRLPKRERGTLKTVVFPPFSFCQNILQFQEGNLPAALHELGINLSKILEVGSGQEGVSLRGIDFLSAASRNNTALRAGNSKPLRGKYL